LGRPSRKMLHLIVELLAAYLILLVLLRVFERRLIFFPNYPDRLAGDWHPRGLPAEDVWLNTADGVRLHAWWIPTASAEFVFVAFHGNASNMANRAEVYRFLQELPASVLAVEYRGYGRSEGVPSEEGIYLDAQAAYDYLIQQRAAAPRRIIVFGQSLGTAAAADLAVTREVGGIVLEPRFLRREPSPGACIGFFPG
jgi:pimeloyl-ACP methyl ester carboxylesterase